MPTEQRERWRVSCPEQNPQVFEGEKGEDKAMERAAAMIKSGRREVTLEHQVFEEFAGPSHDGKVRHGQWKTLRKGQFGAAMCGQCQHWNRKPPDAQNIGVIVGECRAAPPQILFAQVEQPIGPGKVNINLNVVGATYPVLPPNFPACGHFQQAPAEWVAEVEGSGVRGQGSGEAASPVPSAPGAGEKEEQKRKSGILVVGD